MDWQKASAELDRKLDPKHVQPAKQYGPKGEYLEGWFCMAEANRIFGYGAWSYTVQKCDAVMQAERKVGKAQKDGWGVTYVATVRVDVAGVIHEDVGAGHGYDVDLGLAHESAIKEAVTDALKRALRGFGYPFGLALYDKTREHVGVDLPSPEVVKAQLLSCESLSALAAAWKALPADLRREKLVRDAKDSRKEQLAAQKDAA